MNCIYLFSQNSFPPEQKRISYHIIFQWIHFDLITFDFSSNKGKSGNLYLKTNIWIIYLTCT